MVKTCTSCVESPLKNKKMQIEGETRVLAVKVVF